MSEFFPIYLCIGIAVFLACTAIIIGIRNTKKSQLSAEDPDFIETAIEKKKRQLNANLGSITFKQYCTLMALAPILLGIAGWVFGGKLFAVLFATAGLFSPELLLKFGASRQKKKFEERYARALRTLSSGLRSGLTITQAIRDVSQNTFIHASIRDGFKQILADIQIGQSIQDAFFRFAYDSKSDDAMDLAAAISLQADVGGQEAQIVYTLAQNIYDRIMTRKKVDAIFVDTTVMINVMDVLPFALILLIYLSAPEYLTVFFESPITVILFIGILAFTAIGTVVIRRMALRGKGGV